jgi:hypothetical protein
MIVIRTAEDMARALASALDPPLKNRLRTYRDIFAEYPNHAFDELGLLLVVQPGDRPGDLGQASETELVLPREGSFQAEAVKRYGQWFEVSFVLSDDGYGIVVLIPDQPNIDPKLLAACKASQDDALRL